MMMDLSLSHAAPANLSASCCTQLSSLLGSKVVFPDSNTYNTTISSYWSLQEGSLHPSCIIVPGSAQDVSTAVSTLSNNSNCHFAIKGQTHAPAAGFANIESGITIDMTSMHSITVNGDGKIASVGAGAKWLDVYSYLDPMNLTVAGGRNGLVGVGGLTLGGGISYFGPRVGWTCDTVSNFEIVLAGGEIVNANYSHHSDLFRALKGGANNFGIVTRIDFHTISQGPIVGGNIAHNITYIDSVLKAFADIAGAVEYDPYASLVMGLVYTSASKAWSLGTTAIYTKENLKPKVYDELRSIPTIKDTLNVTRLSVLSNESATPQINWGFYTATFSVSSDLLSDLFKSFNATLSTTSIPGSVNWSIAFEPLPTEFTKNSNAEGGNSLGVSPADGNLVVMLLTPIWPSTTDAHLVHQTAEKMIGDAERIAEEMGVLNNFQYLNYADPSQDPIGSYGVENVEAMRKVSRRVDSKRVFQRQVPGGFKLW